MFKSDSVALLKLYKIKFVSSNHLEDKSALVLAELKDMEKLESLKTNILPEKVDESLLENSFSAVSVPRCSVLDDVSNLLKQ